MQCDSIQATVMYSLAAVFQNKLKMHKISRNYEIQCVYTCPFAFSNHRCILCQSLFLFFQVFMFIMCTALPTLHFLFFQRHIHLRTAPNQELTAAAAVATAAKYLKTPNYRTARVQ